MKQNYFSLPLKITLCIALFFITIKGVSQTDLTEGDIAFTRINMDDESFSFVLLVPITNTTQFVITDEAWNGTNLLANESSIQFTATSSFVAGEEISISATSLGFTTTGTGTATLTSIGTTHPNAGNMLGSAGDQLFIYQSAGSPGANDFITGVNANGGVAGSTANAWSLSTSSSHSYLPSGLTNGTDAVGIFPFGGAQSEVDNARYKSTALRTGDKATVLAAIMNLTNWEYHNDNVQAPVGTSFTITGGNTAPVITGTSAGQTVNDNATISPFSAITTTDADSDNLTATIALDVNAKGVITGADSGSGPYTITSKTPAAMQTAIRALVFNPTDNRVAVGLTETTTFTVTVNDGTVDATNNTTTVVSTSVNDLATIGGASAGQTVNDNATLDPFSAVTIADNDVSNNVTVTVALDVNAKGALSGGGFTGTGPYSLASSTPAAAQVAIRALTFSPTDNRVAVALTETTTFTVTVNDGTGDVTNNTTTVVSTSVNDLATIGGASAGQMVNDNATLDPFSAVTIADSDVSNNVTVTVALDVNAKGALSGGGFTGTGPYSLASSTPAAAQASIRALTFNPTDNRAAVALTETTTFTITVNDGTGDTTNNTTTVVSTSVNDLATIGGTSAGQTVNDNATLDPFSTVTIADSDVSNNVTVTVALDVNAKGALSGGGFTGSGPYSLASSTPAAAQAAIRVLTFNPTDNRVTLGLTETTTFTITVNDGTGDATNNTTTVISTSANNFTWTGNTNNDWNTASNWTPTTVPPTNADITIPNGLTNYPTASIAITFNSLTINSGASFIPQSTVTGTVTYKRNLPTTNWYLVSAPVSGETSEDIIANHTFATGTGSNIGIGAYLNNTGPAWAYSNSATIGSVPSGAGLSMKLAVSGDVSIIGTANTTNISFPITTGTRTNFNLIGNPFTSYVNSSTFAATNTGVLSEQTIWLWNGTSYTTYNAVSPIEIAPGQGFFIEAGSSGNVTFATSNQSHQNSDTFMRQAPKPSFELSVENEADKKSTKVFYVTNKTTGFDNGYDSKIFGGVKEDFSIYTELLENNQGKKLAIQTLPNSNLETMVIPVGVTTKPGKELIFSVTSKNLPDGMEVYLEDRIANTFTNLSNENYKVVVKNTTNSTGQFYIHTSAKNLEAIDVKQNLESVSIYKSANNTLTIAGLQTDKALVNVYSILGQKVISTALKSSGSHVIELPKAATGVYIVELNSSLGKISKKIILE